MLFVWIEYCEYLKIKKYKPPTGSEECMRSGDWFGEESSEITSDDFIALIAFVKEDGFASLLFILIQVLLAALAWLFEFI